ncbi:hypothetical protein GCM10022228_00380 [Halomonas cibimaris]|uniref:Uncharacterized protein n=1 Tax=Halomonas cibimaris TaxID=657012 RepID=A0ABP7L1I6_9GAMM
MALSNQRGNLLFLLRQACSTGEATQKLGLVYRRRSHLDIAGYDAPIDELRRQYECCAVATTVDLASADYRANDHAGEPSG